MPIGIQEKHERDSFDEWLDRYKEEREVIQEPTIPEPEHVEISDDLPGFDSQAPDPVLEEKKQRVAQIPAKVIVDVIDTAAISVNSYIAQSHQDGASQEEKASLQDAVANYLRDTEIDISPGKLCLVLILMIYAPKTIQAFQTRKLNQENAALKGHVAELEERLAAYNGHPQSNTGKEAKNGTVPNV